MNNLKEGTPYMLRRDGKLFECNIRHPYIRQIERGYTPPEDLSDELCKLTIDSVLKRGFNSILWLYQHTTDKDIKQDVKNLFEVLEAAVGLDNNLKNKIQAIISTSNKTYKTYDHVLQEIVAMIFKLNDALNDEFLRIRISSPYWKGEGNSIYFRVSSTGFNWFPVIWKLIYNNRQFIDNVNIVTDIVALGQEKYYNHKGNIIKDMPVDEFLELPGNPIVEEYLPVKLLGRSNPIMWKKAYPSTAHELFLDLREAFIDQFFVEVE